MPISPGFASAFFSCSLALSVPIYISSKMPSENPAPSSNPFDPQEVIRRHAEACQAVVDDVVKGRLKVQEFLAQLKLAGAMSAKAKDYG